MNRHLLKWHMVEGSVTYDFTLHGFGGFLGWPFDAFFWAPTISW